MHILMISYWDFQLHGMQVVLKTPKYFAEKGHRVTLLVHSEATSNPSSLINIHPNIDVVRFRLPFRRINLIPGCKRLRQFVFFLFSCLIYILRNRNRLGRISVIYSAEADAVLIGSILRLIYRVPLVTRFYGVSRLTPFYDKDKKKMNKTGMNHIMSIAALKIKAYLVVITDDGSHGKEIIRSINAHSPEIVFLRNGVDLKRVGKKEVAHFKNKIGVEPDNFILLTVSRLDLMKRVDRAVRTLGCLHRKGRKNVKLVVAGDGPERRVLERLVEKEKIADSVIFLGKIPNKQINKMYSICDVFLSLYDYTNIGNPLLESLYSGCCVVTLDVGGTGMVIKDRKNGRLLDLIDNNSLMSETIADAIEEIMDKPQLRSKLREAAKLYSQNNIWSWSDRLEKELSAISMVAQ